jgi:hypothetical protein
MLGRLRHKTVKLGVILPFAGVLNATLIMTAYLHAIAVGEGGSGSAYGWGVPSWTPAIALAWLIAGPAVVYVLIVVFDRAPRRLLLINGVLIFALANLVAFPAYLSAGRIDLWVEAAALNLVYAMIWFGVLDVVAMLLWHQTGSERAPWFNAPHLAWFVGLLAVGYVVAGLVSDRVERFDFESVTEMFVVILIVALPFHLLMEIAERMNKRDAMDAARARRIAERLVANREKEREAMPEVTKADAVAATHLAAELGARLRSSR